MNRIPSSPAWVIRKNVSLTASHRRGVAQSAFFFSFLSPSIWDLDLEELHDATLFPFGGLSDIFPPSRSVAFPFSFSLSHPIERETHDGPSMLPTPVPDSLGVLPVYTISLRLIYFEGKIKPWSYSHSVATVLYYIQCHQQRLSSPICFLLKLNNNSTVYLYIGVVLMVEFNSCTTYRS